MTMARILSLLGLFIGCGILAIAMTGTAQPEDRDIVQSGVAVGGQNCHVEEVVLDEGYGVSRKEQRRVCTATD